jgi:hypothetical protein
MSDPQPGKLSTSVLAQKGEVVVVWTRPITNWFMAPATAREIAQVLINVAEVAEQQMDAENKP